MFIFLVDRILVDRILLPNTAIFMQGLTIDRALCLKGKHCEALYEVTLPLVPKKGKATAHDNCPESGLI
jgi:hypothetical protein